MESIARVLWGSQKNIELHIHNEGIIIRGMLQVTSWQ